MGLKNELTQNAGLITVIGFIIVTLLLLFFANGQQGVFNPPYLRLILNAIFISATSFFVAFVAIRSFLRYGQISFLLLSGALIFSGLGAFMASLFSGISTNANFVLFNVGFLFASILQAFGAVYLLAATSSSKVFSHRKFIVALLLLITVGSMLLLAILTLLDLIPAFVMATGATTDLRQFVVALSFFFLVVAISIYAYQYLQSKARALYWYACALALFALDLFVAYNSAELGDTLQWVGRIADYVAGVFFIIALLSLQKRAYTGADVSQRWFETFNNNRQQFGFLFANMLNGFAYLRIIADGAVDAVFLEVNAAFETNTGLNKKDIVGKRITQAVPGIEKDPAGWLDFLYKIAYQGESNRMESYLSGLKRWLRVSAYSPEEGYVALIVEDITKQKELVLKLEENTKNLEKIVEERTRQLRTSERLAAIGQTAGMVGHDIRNPLQAIVSDLYLIDQEIRVNPSCISEEVEESITAINENITYINKIVSDLQDYTRTLKPTLQMVNVKEIITSVLAGIKVPDTIAVDLPVNTDLEVKSDQTFLRRILQNLITNAIQAMPNGGKLTIDAFSENSNIDICIQDTGSGISEEAKAGLFKPLFTTKAKGQGLGLAVVKRLVESLNGSITYESEKGKGTRFTVALPSEV